MREDERLKKIRDLLLQQSKANWTCIAEKTGIQSKELSYDLMKLLRNGEITTEQDTKDRRITWYMLKDQKKALAESKRFESIEFIRSLGVDVNFAEAEAKDKEFRSKCSVFTNDEALSKEVLQKVADDMAKGVLLGLRAKITMEKLKIKPSFKNAYIITLEKEVKKNE
jgi:DNA-binding MarR family transcriptional regulator